MSLAAVDAAMDTAAITAFVNNIVSYISSKSLV